MKIAFTGASGFIAKSFQQKFKSEDNQFFFLKRNDSISTWADIIYKCDVVINLGGAPVIQRWNKKNRKNILESRIDTTKKLVAILNGMNDENGNKLLISASAIGLYPSNGEHVNTEYNYSFGNDFLTEVVMNWENEAQQLSNPSVRLVIPRIGIVLGKKGGMMAKLLPLFKKGLGGKIASGKQSMAFIHIDDLTNAFQYFIENESAIGVYNMVSPKLTTNEEFTNTLGNILKMPTLFRVPAFLLRLNYGKAAKIMIEGEKVYPQRLMDVGFEFQYDTIDEALNDILKN